MGANRAAVGLALLAACATVACALLLDTSADQCANDGDCNARGGSFTGTQCVSGVCVAPSDGGLDAGADVDPKWGCLDQQPGPVRTDASVAHCDWYLHDFLSQAPVTEITARICPNAADPSCIGSVATLQPDDAGHVVYDLDLSGGPFDGYLAIDPVTPDGGIDGGDPYMPTRVWFAASPIVADLSDDWSLATAGTLTLLAQAYSLPAPDPTLGTTFLVAQDCQHNDTAGVQFVVDATSSNPPTQAFYFQGGAPSSTASETDSSGLIGFLNVPVGARKFSASLSQTKQPIGSVTLYSLAGTLSYAHVNPASAL
jgi:hypothetical protein